MDTETSPLKKNTKIAIAIIPFHDWRKIQLEGFRTRDAHFIEELSKDEERIKIIINRPTTLAEVLAKRKLGLIKSKKVLKEGPFSLYEIKKGLYLVDYISTDVFGQIMRGYSWFFSKYQSIKYISFIEKAFNHLKVSDNLCLLNQNIFAHGLIKPLNAKVKVFDAWDNFNKFKVYEKLKDKIHGAYKNLSNCTDFWITNSKDNIEDFTIEFKPNDLKLITNGVDLQRFVGENRNNILPQDIALINKPIVGFGGKISQLIDVELLNETMRGIPSISFVFVGQILDRKVYEQIEKLPNFHYLGDKHYDQYPNYVKNFDICIVPYVVEKSKKSGANTIKVYEYLAANKKVVGTPSNGLEYLSDYVYIVNNSEEFIATLRDMNNNKPKIQLKNHSWQRKVEEFLESIKANEH